MSGIGHELELYTVSCFFRRGRGFVQRTSPADTGKAVVLNSHVSGAVRLTSTLSIEKMDTDELFEEAREIFSYAYDISEFLRADIGLMAKKFQNENEYLEAIHDFVKSISDDQNEYLEEWSIDEPLDEKKLEALVNRIEKLIRTPQDQRTYNEYE